jgi:hypothetical protein
VDLDVFLGLVGGGKCEGEAEVRTIQQGGMEKILEMNQGWNTHDGKRVL